MTGRGAGAARAWEGLAVVALLAVFTALASGEAAHQSVTVDEFHLVPQAIALRGTSDLDLGYKTPPLVKRWIGLALDPAEVSLPDHRVNGRPAAEGWEPWIFGTRFMLANRDAYDSIFLRARRMMLPLAWLLGLAIWAWARSAGGTRAGIASLALFAFSPEMIAFSSVVSLDLAVTALVVGCLALLREYLRRGSFGWLAGAAALFGLGLSVKLSMITLAPLFLLPAASPTRGRRRAEEVRSVAAAAGIALLALHASYGFDRPVPRWGEFQPHSRGFRSAHAFLPDASPVPLPLRWLRALDGQARDVESADVPSYLDGVWSTEGWRSYYAAAYLYKWPLPYLGLGGLAIAAAIVYLRRRRAEAVAGPRVLRVGLESTLVLAPILLWGGTFSLAGGLNIGIRYVLPCSALAFVGLGILLFREGLRSAVGGLAAALCALGAAASLHAYPHHLAYFNAFAGGSEGAYRRLVDSNLDWGQELKHLAAYTKEKGIARIGLGYFGHVAPELYALDYFVPDGKLEEGWYAVSANFLAGYPYVVWDHGRLRPVRPETWEPFRGLVPEDTIAGVLMIYRVPPSGPGSSGGQTGSDGALATSRTSAWSRSWKPRITGSAASITVPVLATTPVAADRSHW